MPTLKKSTVSTKPGAAKKWHLVDADGKTLGRLASKVAAVLRGKHKAVFTPHVDTGDFVVVINAGRVHLTGKKETEKVYYRHTNYPGGLKSATVGELRARRPASIIEYAVQGMLPKNKLGRRVLKHLKVYEGSEHPHASQAPKPLSVS